MLKKNSLGPKPKEENSVAEEGPPSGGHERNRKETRGSCGVTCLRWCVHLTLYLSWRNAVQILIVELLRAESLLMLNADF
jgi:hypothetical protein